MRKRFPLPGNWRSLARWSGKAYPAGDPTSAARETISMVSFFQPTPVLTIGVRRRTDMPAPLRTALGGRWRRFRGFMKDLSGCYRSW